MTLFTVVVVAVVAATGFAVTLWYKSQEGDGLTRLILHVV